jgi:hypothetical protein
MSQKKITIPGDITTAIADLNGLDALITAKEWQRAAIVTTFVEVDDKPGGDRKKVAIARTSNGLLTPSEFAALGINGLKSKDTVRRYVKMWESTGLPRPKPGTSVELPDKKWPPSETTQDAVLRNPSAVAAALDNPEFVAKVVTKSPEATARIAAASLKTDEGRKAVAKEMVKTGQTASVEKAAAATREESVRVFLDSDEGKAYTKGRTETTAEEVSLKDRLARTGVLSIADMGLLLLSSLHAMEEFTELADSVGNRVEPTAGDTLREIGNRHKAFGQYLIDLADGKTPTKLSDADLEALLTGGV